MTIRVTAVTSGQANPSPLTLGKPYRWRQNPGWTPGDIRYADERLIGAPPRELPKSVKFAAFAAARDEGKGVTEAGEIAGVARKTAQRYERERREALEQEGDG